MHRYTRLSPRRSRPTAAHSIPPTATTIRTSRTSRMIVPTWSSLPSGGSRAARRSGQEDAGSDAHPARQTGELIEQLEVVDLPGLARGDAVGDASLRAGERLGGDPA